MGDGPAGWGEELYSRVLDALGAPAAPPGAGGAPAAGAAGALVDVGCGEGALLRLAADRGLAVCGVDPDPDRLARAADRVPRARLLRGGLDRLPLSDAAAGAVTCVQVLMHLPDPVAALGELRRVTAPGGRLVVTVWGPPERCALGVLGAALAPLLAPLADVARPSPPEARRPRPGLLGVGARGSRSEAGHALGVGCEGARGPGVGRAGGPPHPAGRDRARGASRGSGLAGEGGLAAAVTASGLLVTGSEDVTCPFELPDQRALLTVVHAAELGRRARAVAGSKRVRQALLGALEPHRRADGGYTLENTFRLVTARAPG